MRRSKWEVLDSWALVKGDAEDSRTIDNIKQNMKQSWPGASVITVKRTVKAGGACIPVLAIVARRKRVPVIVSSQAVNLPAVPIHADTRLPLHAERSDA
jgi:hypothetical protein